MFSFLSGFKASAQVYGTVGLQAVDSGGGGSGDNESGGRGDERSDNGHDGDGIRSNETVQDAGAEDADEDPAAGK